MDRISNLPDDIICHIGSLLSAKEAAFAMVLSKRWRNLFTIVPEIHFDDCDDDLKDFSEQVCALPINSRIRKFSLKSSSEEYDDINRCLCHVLKRGVLVLELQIDVREDKVYSLPLEVFTCQTVEKLKLGEGFAIDFLPADSYLPSLKTLCLDSIRFHEFGRCAFNTLLSASPVLEELIIDGVEFECWKWSSTVSSPSLQRLAIRREVWEPESDDIMDLRGLAYEFDSLSFDTPGLTYLEYPDYVPKKYPFVNLDSLVEAKLDLPLHSDEFWGKIHTDDFDPMNLINGLKNVEILDLNMQTLQMIQAFEEVIPMFEKLRRVSFDTDGFCWLPLMILLKKSPNLKTLVLKDGLHYIKNNGHVCECLSKYSFLSSCRIEVLKINEYGGSIGELEQMKHILWKPSCLKLVKIRAQVKGEKRVRLMADLQRLPRASTHCKIHIKFS